MGLKIGLPIAVVAALALAGMYLFKKPPVPQPPPSDITAAQLLKEVWPWLP
jgi:hypothetical protein